jgi:hypothetical protein
VITQEHCETALSIMAECLDEMSGKPSRAGGSVAGAKP